MLSFHLILPLLLNLHPFKQPQSAALSTIPFSFGYNIKITNVLKHFSWYRIDRVVSLRNELDFLISELFIINNLHDMLGYTILHPTDQLYHASSFVKPEWKPGCLILSQNTMSLNSKTWIQKHSCCTFLCSVARRVTTVVRTLEREYA